MWSLLNVIKSGVHIDRCDFSKSFDDEKGPPMMFLLFFVADIVFVLAGVVYL